MINIPLPCKLERNQSSTFTVNVVDMSDPSGAYEIRAISPNSIGESLTLNYPVLTKTECRTVEAAIRGTKGTIRIILDSYRYLASDYSVESDNGNFKFSVSLVRVA